MCLFSDAGGRDCGGAAANVCVCVSMGSKRKEEIILKIMLGLVPTRSLFGESAPFSDVCVCV